MLAVVWRRRRGLLVAVGIAIALSLVVTPLFRASTLAGPSHLLARADAIAIVAQTPEPTKTVK
jgi:hypothetical protein